ncbi:unnamed protein product [Leptosia nina]|uniref:Uncharacterized protein n=1 Tax=Leptosia nina TaxID=320188 RepID=A0AAV1JC76_9NEOP
MNEHYSHLVKHRCHLENVAESAAKVADYTFNWQHATLILFNLTILCSVDVFAKSYNKNINLFNISKGRQHITWHSVEGTMQYVLFVDDIADLIRVLAALRRRNFNTNAKFIIICNRKNNQCVKSRAVEVLWSYRVTNVILIKEELSMVTGYTFFISELCDMPIPRVLKHWNDCIYSKQDKNTFCTTKYMFPVKFRNFRGCPLLVSTFSQVPYMMIEDGVPRGADGDLLRCIVQALNATLVLVFPPDDDGWGTYENNTWTGSLGDVYKGLANFSMTSASVTLKRFQHFDMSVNYFSVNLVWVTHPSHDFESSSLKLVRPYKGNARILVMLTFVVVLLMQVFVKTRFYKGLSARFHFGDAPNSLLFHAFRRSLGLPMKCPKSLFFKYCTFLWVWFWFLARTFYQVHLIESLQTNVPVNSINTIAEAIEEGYTIGSGPALKDYYLDDPFVYENWIDVDTDQNLPIMKNLTEGLKFVLAINLVSVKAFEKATRLRLHVLSERVLKSHTVLFLEKHSHLTKSVNILLNRLFEAGIPDKLFEDYTFTARESKTKAKEPIRTEHFMGCYIILIVGWILSAIVFLVEKIVHRIKLRRSSIY